jgi:hypothetical protein
MPGRDRADCYSVVRRLTWILILPMFPKASSHPSRRMYFSLGERDGWDRVSVKIVGGRGERQTLRPTVGASLWERAIYGPFRRRRYSARRLRRVIRIAPNRWLSPVDGASGCRASATERD